jgi:hypothetical protein
MLQPLLAVATHSKPCQIIELARDGRGVSRFLRVPYSIYHGDPNWVAPLLADLKKVFRDVNPLFEHAEMKLWVATRDGKDVGRIAGILDRNHNEFHKEATAFWGFFESADDPAVAGALFDAVNRWAREKGMNRLLGPMNPTTNDECGLLIEGFDRPPAVMMPYNPRYYVPLVEGAGFTKAKDLLAYHFHVAPKPLERLSRIADGVQRREKDVVVRPIRRKTLVADLGKVKQVYNAAWEANWGFVPMTDKELDFMASRLKPLLVEEYALLAEVAGEPVGFMLSLPDYNEGMQAMRGRLLSPGLLKFLPYLFGWKQPRIGRVLTTGVVKRYQGAGIVAILFARALAHGLKIGTRECEVSWVLEDNDMVIKPLHIFGATKYKTYRIFERAVRG